MEIRFCPDCGDETLSVGLAFWPEFEEPVATVECQADGCGWAGTTAESWSYALSVRADSAA